jgi:hypothetical protein
MEMAMAEAKEKVVPAGKRERSPQFPYISLTKALERIETMANKAGHHEVRVFDVAADWKLSPKSSSTDRNVAALVSYGLVEESGTGEAKKIKISENGWRIMEDKRPGVRDKLLAEAAIKPPVIEEYARHWGERRPDDGHALSQLKFEGGFTDEGATQFLRVFDETIRFTKAFEAAKPADEGKGEGRQDDGESGENSIPPVNPPPPPRGAKVQVMAGERELTTGLLSGEASFRLIVSGQVGVKEIERLIKKLELDKEILAEQEEAAELKKLSE